MTGTVVFFSNLRGYGFIAPEGGGVDIFVHHQSIVMDGYRTLAKQERVSYEIGDKDGKPMAINVHKLEAGNGG